MPNNPYSQTNAKFKLFDFVPYVVPRDNVGIMNGVKILDKNITGGAPMLVPKNGSVNSQTTINVLSDYPWTISLDRTEIPQIKLTEFYVNSSTFLQSIAYQTRATIEAVYNASPSLSSFISNQLGAALADIEEQGVSGVQTATNASGWTQIKKADKELANTAAFMDPYVMMYPRVRSGWSYIIPYLGSQYYNTQTSWGAETLDTFVSDAKDASYKLGSVVYGIKTIIEDVSSAAKFVNTGSPGSYTEQVLSPGKSPPGSITTSFYLINTQTDNVESVRRNWELCYLLTYQNKANRRSISLLDPPVMYKVEISGLETFEFAYISDLKIENVGRTFNVNWEDNQPRIIPEAYKITITLTSMVMPSRNLMLQNLLDNNNITVTTNGPVVYYNQPIKRNTTPTNTPTQPMQYNIDSKFVNNTTIQNPYSNPAQNTLPIDETTRHGSLLTQ